MSHLDPRSLYLGALLLVCLVLGGGTQKGLPTVFVLELLSLPLVFDLALRRPRQPAFGWPVYAMAGLIVLCFAVQFVPVLSPGFGFLTRDAGRTLDSLVYVGFALTLFLAFGRLTPGDQSRMVAWLFLGVILNMALALTQFAASRGLSLELFPYRLGAGFFANPNHFSSLLFVTIPFVIYQFDAIGRLPWASLAVLLIVFVEFAAGSTAGILLSLGCTLISTAVIASIRPVVRLSLLATALLGAGILALNPGDVLRQSLADDPLQRQQIALTTLAAIQQNLPLGSGYGTFDIVYPSVEPDAAVSNAFINHAHNEPLELVLEGGVPAALALLAYLGLLVWRLNTARHSRIKLASLCAIGFILVHSLVDYPLRTSAIVAIFALLNAVYCASDTLHQPDRRHRRRRRKSVQATSVAA